MTERVPAWLNLDEVAPPEIRETMREDAAAWEALLPQIDRLAQRTYYTYQLYNASMTESGVTELDDIDDVLADYTGFRPLWNAVRRVADTVDAAIGNKPETFAIDWFGKEVQP